MKEHKEEKDFTVRDHRSFSAEGGEKNHRNRPSRPGRTLRWNPSPEEQRPAGAPLPILTFLRLSYPWQRRPR